MNTEFTPTPLDKLSSELIIAMSPAAILQRDQDDRVLIHDHRGDAMEEAVARVERAHADLANAERHLAYTSQALTVAGALAHPVDDYEFGRRVGDVVVALEGSAEMVVLGIMHNFHGFGVSYLVLDPSSTQANTGDGDVPVWVSADEFRRP